jgi:hypothetical protein
MLWFVFKVQKSIIFEKLTVQVLTAHGSIALINENSKEKRIRVVYSNVAKLSVPPCNPAYKPPQKVRTCVRQPVSRFAVILPAKL